MFALQQHAGYPKLADYLHAKPTRARRLFAISPKTYAAYASAVPARTRSSPSRPQLTSCDGKGLTWRGPAGVNVPSYLSRRPAAGSASTLGAGDL